MCYIKNRLNYSQRSESRICTIQAKCRYKSCKHRFDNRIRLLAVPLCVDIYSSVCVSEQRKLSSVVKQKIFFKPVLAILTWVMLR